jgi:hypothetical protein
MKFDLAKIGECEENLTGWQPLHGIITSYRTRNSQSASSLFRPRRLTAK